LVEEMGWHWVGRIRNRTLVHQQEGDTWKPCKALYDKATNIPTRLGLVHLVRSHPLCGFLPLVRLKRPFEISRVNAMGWASQQARHESQIAEPSSYSLGR
jgi:hypothetical protein